ncbi:MAG TPA: hypothetical protein VJ438_00185 [Candidatus Nanoarchaeia archaeon]|nr:hypothetical protein [Candidatus Nanoarchaeia archaeon]
MKIKKSKTAYIQDIIYQDFFDKSGLDKNKKYYIFYKRVSKYYKTQENTENETLWTIGSIIEHPNWNPTNEECGKGKFHCCAKAFFCDEFRNEKKDDKYIAIKIRKEDLFEWINPQYPHKIAFKKGKVLYECDKHGMKLKQGTNNDNRH